MEANDLINWIEGYFDACKNKLNVNQIKEIRKKINEYKNKNFLNFKKSPNSEIDIQYYNDIPSDCKLINEDYKNLLEKVKYASTMEDLEKI